MSNITLMTPINRALQDFFCAPSNTNQFLVAECWHHVLTDATNKDRCIISFHCLLKCVSPLDQHNEPLTAHLTNEQHHSDKTAGLFRLEAMRRRIVNLSVGSWAEEEDFTLIGSLSISGVLLSYVPC